MIKTFRGLIGHDVEDTIRLSTNNGLTGYRIVKFQLMPKQPAVDNMAFVVKLYKRSQITAGIDGVVDFDDGGLLAAGYYEHEPSSYSDESVIISDREIFNQDIYITCWEHHQPGDEYINFYIELEQVSLDLSEATVATLKDMRGSN